MKFFSTPHSRRWSEAGLSLIEIMVSVALLTVIILGLLGMFNQTQKAFRSGMAQVDVLDSARASMEMMTRELEQTTASGSFATNLEISTLTTSVRLPTYNITNVLQKYFFLTKSNNLLIGTGYLVTNRTLYRFSSNINLYAPPESLYGAFTTATTNTGLGRVAEGVVHLRLRAFNKHGEFYRNSTNSPSRPDPSNPSEQNFSFRGNDLPSFVELEFGVVEPQVLGQIKSMPVSAATQFLENQAGRIHLFRQRIPIRTAVP